MNPRDLPEVVSELIIEMHEVRSELNALNGRVDRLERTVEEGFKALQAEIRESSRATVDGITRGFEPFLNRLMEHDDQLRKHAGRLNNLESPQQ
jgi:ubiquinone biosynthesis protein UbiJ